MFVLDASGSIGRDSVQEMTGFLELVINSLNVDANETDPTATRVGMLTFADSATIYFHLSTYSDRTEILQAINVRYSGGTTNTSDAIRYEPITIQKEYRQKQPILQFVRQGNCAPV